MNLKRFYDDSSVGSAENLVARAVPLSTVFCRQHLAAGSEESVTATDAVTAPYHHRSRIDLQQQQQQQHAPLQQTARRYAEQQHHAAVMRVPPPQHHHHRTDMTSQQRIERMSRIMKQQNQRPELTPRFRHTMTLVSPIPFRSTRNFRKSAHSTPFPVGSDPAKLSNDRVYRSRQTVISV